MHHYDPMRPRLRMTLYEFQTGHLIVRDSTRHCGLRKRAVSANEIRRRSDHIYVLQDQGLLMYVLVQPAPSLALYLNMSTTDTDQTKLGPINPVTRSYMAGCLKLGLHFTVYHRLSMLVIVPNLFMILYGILERNLFQQPRICLSGVAANVAAAVLIRQDHIINILFWSFGQLPHRTPLWLRKHAAKLYHLGGIHSGAGVAAGIWFLFFNIAAVHRRPRNMPLMAGIIATVALCTLMDILFLQILVFSIPVIRTKFHDLWEQMHRFSGWMLLTSFWAFPSLYNIYESRSTSGPSLGELFYFDPAFYLLSITTLSVILPWLRLRRVRPRSERLSEHAVRLHFDCADVSACKTPRFSTSPLSEWHSFASIPNESTKGYSIIVSRAGDWTSKIIDETPSTLWTRGRPARGVLYMARMFRTILCVGTGSGIAPILGLLTLPNLKFRILWSAPDPERTFGSDIMRRVLRADSDAVIWDTNQRGRPNLVAEAKQIYNEGDTEAVFVISNAKVTADVVRGLESQNIPAFGPIFDS